MQPLISSTRLYNVSPAARTAWEALLQAAYKRADIRVQMIEHAWPQPVAELWARPGLCGAFMCGWPFWHATRTGHSMEITALAGVVPDFAAYEGQARYRSEFLVRADSGWKKLEDSFGTRYGWMVKDSQSGWNAPRSVLARHAQGKPLFAQSSGPYGNPLSLLKALHDQQIDITAVDGWYLDLLRAHTPEVMLGLQTLACTPWTPNPLLVTGRGVAPDVARRLQAELLDLQLDSECAPLLAAAHVARFTPVDPSEYSQLDAMAEEALALGYPEIA
jgi:ABC-type phosphate/phosphonate transport system substrate-binding protein